MAETNAQRKKRRIIPNTLAETERPAVTEQATFQQQPSARSEFARTSAGGLRQLEALGQQAVGAGAALVGADEFAEERIAAGQQAQQEAAQFAPRVGRIEDIRTEEGFGAFAEDAADYVIGVAGQQGPILGATILGGAAGAAARKVAPAAVASRVSAPAAAATGAVGTGIGLETGSIFGEVTSDPEARQNFSLQELAGISAVGGTAAGSLEALPVISAFKRFGLGKSATRAIRSSLAKRVAKGAGSQAALEGATEGAQTVIERAAAKFANENREILGEEGFSEIINAIAAGAIIGGPLGGLSGGFQQGDTKRKLEQDRLLFVEKDAAIRERQRVLQQKLDQGITEDDDELINIHEDLEDLQAELFQLDQRREALDISSEEFQSSFQPGSVEDQLDLEDSLDELEATGGRSSDIDLDLDELGQIGVDIRSARSIASEDELLNQPERVVDRLVRQALETGGFESRRQFPQLVEAVSNLENPAQLDNILANAGVDAETRPLLRDALIQETEKAREEFLSLAVNERPDSQAEETGLEEFGGPGGFQSPNVTRSHILRNGKGKLGFIESNNPLQENSLRRTLTRLERDFPDIEFGVDGLGDAILAGLPSATRKDPEKVRKSILSVAQEKLNEKGLKTEFLAPIDPNNPIAFLNQFKTIRKEEVNVALSGRDEFRLTDSDLGGATKKPEVQVGGPVTRLDPRTKKPIGRVKAKVTVRDKGGRPIFVNREVSKDGDFTVSDRGREQTVDAIALTNRMLAKREGDRAANTQEVADAFFTGLTALQQRGVEIGFVTGGMPDDLIIHKKPGVNGRILTWGQIKVQGSARIRARIMAFKEHEKQILAKIKENNKNMKSSKISPAAKRNMQRIVKKLERRVKKIPGAIETLNIFGRSVSRDVQDITRRLNDAAELTEALGNDAEGLSDIAVEVQELRRQLEREGFNTVAAEELSNIGEQLEDLDQFAMKTQRKSREGAAREGSQDAGESGPGRLSSLEEEERVKIREKITRLNSSTQITEEEAEAQIAELTARLDAIEAKKNEIPGRPTVGKEGELVFPTDAQRKKIRYSAGELDINLPIARELVEKINKKNISSALFARDGLGFSDLIKKHGAEKVARQKELDKQIEQLFDANPGVEVGYDENGDAFADNAVTEGFADKLAEIMAELDALDDGLRLGPTHVDEATQVFIEREAARMLGKLNLENVAVLTGDEAADFLRLPMFKEQMTAFSSGTLGGFASRRIRTAEEAGNLLEKSGFLDRFPENSIDRFEAKKVAVKEIMASQKQVWSRFSEETNHVIIVNPFLTNKALLAEILAHEIGHVVFQTRYNTASAEVQGQIRDDFDRWREELGKFPDASVAEAFASKRGFEFALSGFEFAESYNTALSELPDPVGYVMDFEEWFADQTSRWFNPAPSQEEQLTAVDAFFKDVANSVRILWNIFTKAFGFEPAPSIRDFLDDLVHKNPVVEMDAAVNSMVTTAAKVGLDTDDMGIASIFQSIDPFGSMANHTVRAAMKSHLKKDERKILFRYFNRRSVKNQLKKLLTDPAQQQMIENSPILAAAFGYQTWVAGTFKISSPSQETAQSAQATIGAAQELTSQNPFADSVARTVVNIFRGLFDAIAARLGFVYESDQAEQILEAIRNETVDSRRAGTDTFSVIKAVRNDVLQRVAQTGNAAFEHIKPFFDKAIGVADSRMLDSGIPAFVSIAQIFHARTGGEQQGPSFFEARTNEIGKFMNSYTRITADLQKDPALKEEVMRLLRNPGAKGSAAAISRASAVRKLLRRIRNYMEANGMQIGDRGKDYFPWVFDTRKVQENSDWFRKILADERFDVNMQGILENINEGIRNQNLANQNAGGLSKTIADRPEITKEEMIEHMMMGLEQSEGLADTNLDPSRAGTTPFFAAMNKRTLGFLTKENGLTKSEREFFDSMFSDQLDLTMMTYIRQAVKRTEYTKRAGARSEILRAHLANAVDEGASADEMRMAHSYIDAMTGVIGEDTNNRFAKVLGLKTRNGEVINPHWRQFTSIAMVLQNLAVLPLATFTSLVDPVGILVRSQDLKATMTALRVGASEIANEIKLLVGGDEKKARSELRQLAEGMGVIEDHMTNEALEWEYGSTYLTPKLKATNEWFFKAIGLTQWTRVTRLMALAGGKEFIKRHVKRPNQNSERFLKQLNLDPADVKFDDTGQIQMLSRLEREGDSVSTEELQRDDRVRNALNRFVDESILRPNAAQRPIWASDPNYSLVFHLKSFMFSFHDRILRRAGQEAEMGNMVPLMLLAVFIPAMLMADILRDLIQYGLGGNPRKADWGLEDHLWSASQRSGLNGIGQLLIDAKQDIQFGGIGYESLAGPTVDGIADLGGLFSDDDEAQWNAFTRNLPGSTVWKHWLENGFDE